MKDFFRNMAELRIREAIASGEFKNFAGAGKPIKIKNFYFLPPESKFAYSVLKNSGYLNLADEQNTTE